MADWVSGGLNLHAQENGCSVMDEINVVANRVADCLPIQEGEGNATISEQLGFWSENRQLFDTAREGRQAAADLVTAREEIIDEIFSYKTQLQDAERGRILIKMGGLGNVILSLRRLGQLKSLEADLKRRIAGREPDLEKTDDKWKANRELLESITSKIDCKLPAVVTGEILKNAGWKVALLCFNHPEHPSLLALKSNPDGTQTEVLIDYNSTPSKFRSNPHIRPVENRRYITGSRYTAEGMKFISKSDRWPLPFDESSFQKFDNWYIDHVRNREKMNELSG